MIRLVTLRGGSIALHCIPHGNVVGSSCQKGAKAGRGEGGDQKQEGGSKRGREHVGRFVEKRTLQDLYLQVACCTKSIRSRIKREGGKECVESCDLMSFVR